MSDNHYRAMILWSHIYLTFSKYYTTEKVEHNYIILHTRNNLIVIVDQVYKESFHHIKRQKAVKTFFKRKNGRII